MRRGIPRSSPSQLRSATSARFEIPMIPRPSTPAMAVIGIRFRFRDNRCSFYSIEWTPPASSVRWRRIRDARAGYSWSRPIGPAPCVHTMYVSAEPSYLSYWTMAPIAASNSRAHSRVYEFGGTAGVAPHHSELSLDAVLCPTLFNVEGRFFAVSNVCLHRGGPIGEGMLDDAVVTCPNHGWEYDVRTGANVANPMARLRTFEVRIHGDDVLVGA